MENLRNVGNPRFFMIVLTVVSFFIYSPSLLNKYNLDDELVTENHALKNTNFKTLFNLFSQPYYQDAAGNRYEYRPMVMVTFFFEFLIFGKSPAVSHLINLLLYSLTCLLIFKLLTTLFESYKYSLFLSFTITLFFAVHPLHSEAVASVKNRDELLSLLLGVSAWILALRFVDTRSIVHYALYLVCFLAALFSKQTTITFSLLIPVSVVMFRQVNIGTYLALGVPLALLASAFSPIYLLFRKAFIFVGTTLFLVVFYYLVEKRDGIINLGRNLGGKVKTFFTRHYKLAGGIAGVVGVLFIGTYLVTKQNERAAERFEEVRYNVNDRISDFNELQLTPLMNTPAPSVIPIAGRKLDFVETPMVYVTEPAEKYGTSLYVMGYYLKMMFVPYPLRFYYGYNQIPISDFGSWVVILSLIIYVCMAMGIAYLLFKRKHMVAAFGMLFFLLAMIPLSNLVTPIAGVVAERLAYAASLGFCIAFCYFLLYPGLDENGQFYKWKQASRIAFFGIIAVFAVLTFSRNFAWKDHLTLFRTDIKHLDNSARAHHLYGSHLAYSTISAPKSPESVKRLQEAVPHFQRAIEIWPDFPYAHFDLAKTYLLLGDTKSAIAEYTKSTQMDTLVAPPFFELGVVLMDAGRYAEAEKNYKIAIRKDSSFMQAYTNLSYLLYTQGRFEESIQANLTALRHKPNTYEPLVNLGKTYMRLQDYERALYYMEKALAINRSDKGMIDAVAEIYRAKGNTEKEQYYRNLK